MLYNLFTHGKLERSPGSSITEGTSLSILKHMVAKYCLHVHSFIVLSGIGQGRLTNNLNGAPIDYAMMVSDDESVSMVCCN